VAERLFHDQATETVFLIHQPGIAQLAGDGAEEAVGGRHVEQHVAAQIFLLVDIRQQVAQRLAERGAVGRGGDPSADVAIYTPATTADATPADFGDVALERRSPLLWVTVENTGDERLWVDGASVTGPGSASFTVAGETCTAGPIAPGKTCRVSVRFTPAAEGAASASLELADNEASGAAVVPLDGVGVAGADGADGRDGSEGADGQDGADGADGKDGATGPAGPAGLDGATGPAGPIGPQGPAGRSGTASAPPAVSCTSRVVRARARGRANAAARKSARGRASQLARTVETRCRVTLATPAARAATVTLRHGGRTLASARIRAGRRTITLKAVTRAVPRGRFVVAVRSSR